MRGKADEQAEYGVQSGITPAYAGKSGDTVLCSLLNEDHPRLCGEKFGYMTTSKSSGGSPPPMRGKG